MRTHTLIYALFLLVLLLTGAKPMTENEKHFAAAAKLIVDFQGKKDAEPRLLEQAADELSAVDVSAEQNAPVRLATREATLRQWFALLHLLDCAVDPEFDSNKPPPRRVSPPQEGDVVYVGASPSDIRDPKLRAEYEKALAKNYEDNVQFNRQINLRAADEYISLYAEDFVRDYAATRGDEALSGALADHVKPQRALKLLRAASKKRSHP